MLRFHSDPGHGWLQVTLADVQDVGLSLQSFTRYSYRQGNLLFLEEDCDAGVFMQAYSKKYGREPEYVHTHTDYDSAIRHMPRLTV